MARLKLRVPAAVKRVTNPVIGRVPIRIRGGENRGMRWSLASAGGGYGSGRRAARQLRLVAGLIRAGDVVWDVGAHHGFVTLTAARSAGAAGAVHAFEPSQRNRWFLQRHVRWNGLENVQVHGWAVGAFDGTARFGGGSTSKQFSLGGGDQTVEVRTARTLIDSAVAPRPDFVKMDIEGAEADVLESSLDALGGAARMLVAVHSPAVYERCVAALRAAGYEMLESERMRAHRRGRWRGDADLYCCGPAAATRAADLTLLTQAGF